MRATYIDGAGDIRVINVPDPAIRQPTDAIGEPVDEAAGIALTRAAGAG